MLGLKEVQSRGVDVVVGEVEDGEEEVGEDMVVDGDKSPRTISLRLRNKLLQNKSTDIFFGCFRIARYLDEELPILGAIGVEGVRCR